MSYSGPTNLTPTPSESSILQYGYVPSLGMGIVGVVTFLLISVPHLWWFVKKRGTRSVHGLFFFAALIEALGYGVRLYMYTHVWNGYGFLFGIGLIQVATILVTAALYKSVQRGIKYTPDGRRVSPMRPRSMLTLFVILDTVWALIQIFGQYSAAAAAGAEILNAESAYFALGTSTTLFLAGNVLQAITIIIFSVFLFVIIRRSSRLLAAADPSVQFPLLKPLYVQIGISVLLFFVRLIMRIAEGAQGAYGFSMTHEYLFGVFEYLPIFLIFILWAARPLYKFLFPFGHRHGEGAHTVDVEPAHLHSTADSASGSEEETKAKAPAQELA